MARKVKKPADMPDKALIEADKPSPRDEQEAARNKQLLDDEDVREALVDLFKDVTRGFNDQEKRANDQMDYWDVYNCVLTGRQFYSGNSQIFVPITHNAVNARKTRFVNQIFPNSGRHVEVTSSDGTYPDAITSLLEHYIHAARLRTKIMPPLMVNGDVEGQYNLYVSWAKRKKHVVFRTEKQIDAEPGIPTGIAAEDIVEETIETGRPDVEVLADSDVLVLPATAQSAAQAVYEMGGSVTVIRRWSKSKIKQMIADEEIDEDAGEELLTEMTTTTPNSQQPSKNKKLKEAAGIHDDGGTKHAVVYETWTQMSIDGERRICRAFFAGDDNILGCKRNPLWSDDIPIISEPVDKLQGSFKGQSKIAPVADMQYLVNDACNEAMDSAAYALMPIVMTDPEKNPRIGSMILSLAAVWETSPNDTQFAQFPELWKQGFEIIGQAKAEIKETLGVNPSMITQYATLARRNQAEIAQEQQVDMLTTADAVTVIENGVLTPLLRLFVALDHQYRDKEITVRQFGDMGVKAAMQTIKPIQMDNHYEFRWFGVEAARNAQQIQQQISGLNVMQGIPPQMYPGYQLNLAPLIKQITENVFGPRLAPLVFKDIRDELSLAPEFENDILMAGMEMPVHPMDNHQQHMQVHFQAMQAGDPSGAIRAHMIRHQMAREQQVQAQMVAEMQGGAPPGQPPGQPGAPGGGQQPGIAGRPRPGAVPAQQRPAQQPPGAIHQDQMHDPSVMPRKTG